jgi:hypothetical protein
LKRTEEDVMMMDLGTVEPPHMIRIDPVDVLNTTVHTGLDSVQAVDQQIIRTIHVRY